MIRQLLLAAALACLACDSGGGGPTAPTGTSTTSYAPNSIIGRMVVFTIRTAFWEGDCPRRVVRGGPGPTMRSISALARAAGPPPTIGTPSAVFALRGRLISSFFSLISWGGWWAEPPSDRGRGVVPAARAGRGPAVVSMYGFVLWLAPTVENFILARNGAAANFCFSPACRRAGRRSPIRDLVQSVGRRWRGVCLGCLTPVRDGRRLLLFGRRIRATGADVDIAGPGAAAPGR